MDTKQITTFLALVEEKTYARAAMRLNYAPATLVGHIQTLENELGVKLFSRACNQSKLTQEGEVFVPYARQMLRLQNQFQEKIHAGQVRETLRVATPQSLGTYALFKLFRDFCNQHLDCKMQVRSGNCADFCDQLMHDQVDLIYIFTVAPLALPGVTVIPLYEEDIMLVAAPQHPLAQKESVTYADLEDQRFAFIYGNCCYTMAFRRMLEDQGVTMGAYDYLGNVEMVKKCAMEDRRIALLTACSTEVERREGRLVALNWTGKPLRAQAVMCYRKERGEDEHIRLLSQETQRFVAQRNRT